MRRPYSPRLKHCLCPLPTESFTHNSFTVRRLIFTLFVGIVPLIALLKQLTVNIIAVMLAHTRTCTHSSLQLYRAITEGNRISYIQHTLQKSAFYPQIPNTFHVAAVHI